MTRMRRLGAQLAFPLMTVVPVAASLLAIRAGAEPILVIVCAVAVCLLAQVGLEVVWPFRKDWAAARSVPRELPFLALATLSAKLADVAIAAGVGLLAVLMFGAPLSVWPSHWPLAAQLLLALLLADFGHYWAHRALHDVKWLWRFHELHHSPTHLHALNFFRMHPVEIALKTVGNMAPLLFLGAPAELTVAWSVVSAVGAGSVNHCNIAMNTRLFDLFFSTPATHRLHHAVDPKLRGNLGNVTMLFDWIFGTYRNPARHAVGEVGTVE